MPKVKFYAAGVTAAILIGSPILYTAYRLGIDHATLNIAKPAEGQLINSSYVYVNKKWDQHRYETITNEHGYPLLAPDKLSLVQKIVEEVYLIGTTNKESTNANSETVFACQVSSNVWHNIKLPVILRGDLHITNKRP